MSTMDSQLLTLSSMFTRDVYPMLAKRHVEATWPGKVFVLILGALGLFFAINPTSTIIHIATQAFTGLAVLFPTVLFGLYSKKPRPLAALCSIIVGETLVVLSYAKVLPLGGFLPAVPVMAATFAVYLAVAALQGVRPRTLSYSCWAWIGGSGRPRRLPSGATPIGWAILCYFPLYRRS
jgi:SSS family solute:Na+ symporter